MTYYNSYYNKTTNYNLFETERISYLETQDNRLMQNVHFSLYSKLNITAS